MDKKTMDEKTMDQKTMDEKKMLVKKIFVQRRMQAKLKFLEQSNSCIDLLKDLQKKHSQLSNQLLLLNTVKLSTASERLIWKIERSKSFWEVDCQNADENFFKNNFRVSRRNFNKLCELLHGLRKDNTNMRDAISLEKRIAISLYALGSSAEYRTIANMFGVGKSTVCDILIRFCTEVWRVMAPLYLNNFPLTSERVKYFVREFETLGYPQCMGALDGCHIEIHPPHEDATDYYNYKGWYSVVLLALVDARCRFTYVSCGSPGRCNDSQIFQQSALKQQLDQCNILAELKKNISEVDVPVHIIGDSAFRLTEKVMKPYPFLVSQDYRQKCFNYALSKSRRVVENAFGHLKARFRRIGKGIDNALKNVNTVVLSCCVLHNFLNENNDTINELWLQALGDIEMHRSYPEYITTLMDHRNNPERIRHAISEYLYVCSADGEFDSDATGGDRVIIDDDDDGGEGEGRDIGSLIMS